MKIVFEDVQGRCAEEFEKVKKNPYYFENTPYQSEEMCLWAVSKKPEFLRNVVRQTTAICIEAVKKDPYLIEDVEPRLLAGVLSELNLIYLPKGDYNPAILVQKQEDGQYVVRNVSAFIRSISGIPLKEYLEKLNDKKLTAEAEAQGLTQESVDRYNLSIRIQRQFFRENGLDVL